MYTLKLSQEQLEIRDTVREFAVKDVRPKAILPERMEALDRSPMWDLLDQGSQMGLRTLSLPEELGGAGADHLTAAIVAEELAAGDVDLAQTLATTSAVARYMFANMADGARKDALVSAFTSDDRYHLAFADSRTETDLGVNYHRPFESGKITATAEKAGDDWILNGESHCVANAPLAKLIVVSAKPTSGAAPMTFLVPRETPGLRVNEHKPGRFHGSCGEVVYKGCRIPADAVLAAGTDAKMMADLLGGRASPIAHAINLGVGKAAFDSAVEYAGIRVQGGKRLIEHAAIGAKLADCAIRLEAARNMVWKAAYVLDQPDALADRSIEDMPLAAMAHVYTAEQIHRATKDAAEVFGAMGVMRDMPAHKYIQDARMALHIGAGVDDSRLIIAEAIAGYRRA